MKKLILFFGIFLCVIQSKSQVLNVSEVIQEQTQWCWAAVSSCILDYYCTPTEQCVIAEFTRNVATWHNFGNIDCCIDPHQGCNYWNYNWSYAGSIQHILQHFASISNYGWSGSLSQAQTLSDIGNNRLFVIRWGWTGGGGHFLVGHGLIDNNMYYMDPWFGEGLKIADYSWVCSSGNHTWTHTNRLSVSPTSEPPLADFSSDNIEVEIGQEVTFLCQSTGSITLRTWFFENGTPYQSNEINPVVIWNEAGTFNVSLEIENACGSNFLLIENYITVNSSYIQGDSNGDGIVNVLDIIATVNYIMGMNPEPFVFENADVNNDGVIDVLDIIGNVNIILGNRGN